MLCWTQDHKDFLFSSRSFKVWGLTFDLWSILSFYITCKVRSSFPFLQMDVWLFQHFLFKRLSLSTELPLQAPWSQTDRHIRGVFLGYPSCPGMRHLSCVASHCLHASLTSVLMSARVLQLCSFPDHLDDSRSLPLPHGLPLVEAPFIVPTGRKMGYSGPHCLAHSWSWPGVTARRGLKIIEDSDMCHSSSSNPPFKLLPFVHVFF